MWVQPSLAWSSKDHYVSRRYSPKALFPPLSLRRLFVISLRDIYNLMLTIPLSVAASNIYREDDKPAYRRGNKTLLGIAILNIVLSFGVKGFYTWANKRREKIWSKMTEQEKIEHMERPEEEGSKRLDFRFVS